MLMCLKHWRMVPKKFQDDVWKHYVSGQEIRKDPTSDYLKAQQAAVIVVLMKERNLGIEEAARLALPHLK